MQKFLVYIFILLLLSCSGSPSSGSHNDDPVVLSGPLDIRTVITYGSDNDTAVSRPVVIESGNQTFTITGLESGKLYTIYATRMETSDAVLARSTDIVINNLGGGTFTFVLPEGVTEIEFKASEIGLENGGEFRIGDVAAAEITFQDGLKGMTIGQGVTDPVYINADGGEIYEAFYSIDVSELDNPENIVITEVLAHSGEGGGSHFYCFVDKYGREITTAQPRAVIDLSDYDVVYLYNQMVVDYSNNYDMTDSLYLLNPTSVNVGETFTLSNPSTFIVAPSSSPQYLIVNRPSDVSLGVFINDINARLARTGERFSHVLPVEATAEHIIINIPAHSEDILFDYDGEDLCAELIPADGHIRIEEMKRGTKTFTVPAGMFIFPVICTDPLIDCTLSMTTDIPDGMLKYTLINRDGDGYGQGMISGGESMETGDGRSFDWFFFRTYERKGGTFTLTIQ